MAGDQMENASYQLLVGGLRLLAWCLGLLLPVLDGVFTAVLVLYRATYNIAYQLSFRWNRDSAAGEPMDDYLPRAKGDLPQEAYTYVSLPSERHIRILQLKQPSVSGLRSSVIECDLLLVPLNKPSLISSYRAISYSWDGQSFDRYILCGGKKLAITKNCEDILRHMLRHARLFIWIDAICINQGSPEEKAIQVPLMTEIYGRAYLVNVWLGLPTEGTGLVFSYVWLFWCCSCFPEPAKTWLTRRLHGIIAARGHTPYFLDMLHRSWWRRVWTIQESVLAPDSSWSSMCPLLVNCGRFEMPMDCLAIALLDFSSSHKLYQEDTYIYNYTTWAYLVTCHLDRRAFSRSEPSLDLLLFRCRACHVTEPKDRIYGLYGVLERLGIRLSEVDYNKTKEQVYLEFTREACQATNSLSLLNLVAGSNNTATSATIPRQPSWVPDYGGPYRMGDNWASSGLRASSGLVPDFHFSIDGRVLRTVGVLVDTIKEKTTTTIWQPSGDPALVEDGDLVSLEWGFLQTVRAYREWNELFEKHIDTLWVTYGSSCEGVVRALKKVLTLRQQACYPPAAMYAWMHLIDKRQDRSGAFMEANWRLERRKDFKEHRLRSWFRFMMTSGQDEEEWQTLCALKMCPKASDLNHAIWMHNADRQLFVTKRGFLGSANMSIREGDAIFVLSGVDRPMILRPQGTDPNLWTILGPAYIDGMMEGQLWDPGNLQLVSII
ncbi:hypothetical protein GGTG_13560 [Gaeumannomyces tritici R3-111a-1]|uniref:Heterokaryon incompatibility domain-containing protein n=1 Tax=Gaeumannomyces tritici (strain R3-111a-1) TaxID=644352 RepID=J3PJ78_GAET3|nr:hypothetical protein GGTG_13560 [Gaeumannomyces tritici R3-111a-1]EJT68896.1 hypothetical protein GGTG_13560 [Gaeumannomyces tritici R3-111a-1]